MPDDPHTDWTDDADFWDEAWTDMQARLEAAPAPDWRRAAGWWLFAGALLLLLAAGGWWYAGSGTPPPADTRLAAGSTSPAPPTASAPAAAPPEIDLATGEPEPTTIKPMAADASAKRTVLRAATAQTASIVTQKPSPASPASAVQKAAPHTVRSTPAHSTQEAKPRPVNRAVIPATALLPADSLAYFTYDQRLLKNYSIASGRKARPHGLSVSAGASRVPGSHQTGGYFGLTYAAKPHRRLRVPVSLRYTRTHHPAVRSSGSDQQLAAESDTTGFGQGFTPLNLASLSVRTEALELSAALSYRLGRRFRLGAGIGLGYQLSTRYRLRQQDFAPPAVGGFDTSDLLLDSFGRSQLNGFLSLNSSARPASVPDLQRWLVRADVSAAYCLTDRLSLTVEASRLLSTYDRAGVTDLPVLRWGAGVNYRLW